MARPVAALLKFECVRCGQRLAADATAANERGVCPACGHENIVPIARERATPLSNLAIFGLVVGGTALLGTVFALLLLVGSWWAPATTPPPLSPTQMALARGQPTNEPSSALDENLLLIRKLEGLYDALAVASTSDEPQRRLQQVRAEALKTRHYLAQQSLDASICGLYDGFLELWDAGVAFEVATGKINAEAASRLSTERLSNSLDTGWSSGELWGELENAGGSTGESLTAAVLFGVARWFIVDSLQFDERNSEQQTRLAAAATTYHRKRDSELQKASDVAVTLSTKYGWQRRDAGFDTSEAERERIDRYTTSGDIRALRQVAADQIRLRPSDPYAVTNYISLRTTDTNLNKPEDYLANADMAHAASKLLPSAPLYNGDRRDTLLLATWNSLQAADAYGNDAFLLKRNELTELALAYSGLLEAADPKDSLGTARLLSAWAHAHANDLEHARSLLEEVRPYMSLSADFDYLDARVASRQKRGREALAALRAAFSHGFDKVSKVRRSHDFAPLSSRERDEVRLLTSVSYEWQIAWGQLWGSKESVMLTNKSAFPLTNIEFKPVVTKDGQRIAPVLRTSSIAPGASYTWTDCMYVTGGEGGTANATLRCDQGL